MERNLEEIWLANMIKRELEGKRKTVKLLYEIYKLCYPDLMSMEYCENKEVVKITYLNGSEQVVNVHMDSIPAMVRDIAKEI